MWEPKRQIIMQKAQAEVRLWNQFCFRPAAWAWELGGVWASTWANWIEATLSSSSHDSWALTGSSPLHSLLEIRNPRKGKWVQRCGWLNTNLPTRMYGFQSVGPKFCLSCLLNQFLIMENKEWELQVSHMRLELSLGLRGGREQGKKNCSWFWVCKLISELRGEDLQRGGGDLWRDTPGRLERNGEGNEEEPRLQFLVEVAPMMPQERETS